MDKEGLISFWTKKMNKKNKEVSGNAELDPSIIGVGFKSMT